MTRHRLEVVRDRSSGQMTKRAHFNLYEDHGGRRRGKEVVWSPGAVVGFSVSLSPC